MEISKNKILIILAAFILCLQTIHLHINKPNQRIDVDLLIQANKEKYEDKLKDKEKNIKESQLFEVLQTDIKIPNNANIEYKFNWTNENKEKFDTNKNTFDTVYLANLILYHNHIRDIYSYTKSSTIIESFIKMLETIITIEKQTSVFTEKDISTLKRIKKDFDNFRNSLDLSINEINEFDNKIIKFLNRMKEINKDNFTVEKFTQQIKEELPLILEMLSKSDNLYINISSNGTGDPFIKFQGFLDIYNDTYKLYTSLISKHNEQIEKDDFRNTWLTTILSFMLIFIAFYKDIKKDL